MPRISQDVADAVAQDGLARQATDETGAAHVLYLEAGRVRSMLARDWPPPLPSDPTPAESQAAIRARATQAAQDRADAQTLRQRVVSTAQSAVGVSLDALTPAQVRALLAVLLHKAGGVTSAGAVRPLGEWL